ncbi:MAG: hypothetical protein WBE88_06920 [Candidatus Acidiferrales bacterium]
MVGTQDYGQTEQGDAKHESGIHSVSPGDGVGWNGDPVFASR